MTNFEWNFFPISIVEGAEKNMFMFCICENVADYGGPPDGKIAVCLLTVSDILLSCDPALLIEF